MPFKSSSIHADRRIYLLADHLDAVLAAGEDLRKLKVTRYASQNDGLNEGSGPDVTSVNAFVAQARELEIAAMGRIKQAREHAIALTEHLTEVDHQFALLADLFSSGTAIVVDAIDRVCNSEQQAFEHGFDPLVYLRSRGLIHEDSGCLAVVEEIELGEDFLLAGQIELGALLDMCATFLDALERHFDLFPEIPPAVAERPPSALAAAAQAGRA